MRTGSDPGHDRQAVDERRGWQEVILACQHELAEAVIRSIDAGGLDRAGYLYWLATESALCRLGATALEAVSAWHATQPPLRAAALAWAGTLHIHARAAAADVRRIDVIAPALPPQIGPWQAFLQSTCGSARAGEALGAVVLHARLMRGPVRGAIAAVAGLPFAGDPGCGYLLQRSQPEHDFDYRQQAALLDAYSAAALAAGARRAADWYRALLDAVLTSSPTAAAGIAAGRYGAAGAPGGARNGNEFCITAGEGMSTGT